MEQGNSITDKEREVCEILLNFPYLIKKSESYNEVIVWGVRGKRSAIDLTPSPPHHCQPEKMPRIVAEGSSPGSPLSLPSSESNDRVQQYREKVQTGKSREELSVTIGKLVQTREQLAGELEKVKSHHNMLKAYNTLLKAKQQELQLRNPCNQTHSSSSPLQLSNLFSVKVNHTGPHGLLDLNAPDDEVVGAEHLQPLDHKVQARADDNKARAAEARRRRMVRVRKMKLNLAPIKTSKC